MLGALSELDWNRTRYANHPNLLPPQRTTKADLRPPLRKLALRIERRSSKNSGGCAAMSAYRRLVNQLLDERAYWRVERRMELADPAFLHELLTAARSTPCPGRSQNAAMSAAGKAPSRVRGRQIQRCSCGGCRRCAENAGWERIFQEKFADLYYYSARMPYRGSSLSFLV